MHSPSRSHSQLKRGVGLHRQGPQRSIPGDPKYTRNYCQKSRRGSLSLKKTYFPLCLMRNMTIHSTCRRDLASSRDVSVSVAGRLRYKQCSAIPVVTMQRDTPRPRYKPISCRYRQVVYENLARHEEIKCFHHSSIRSASRVKIGGYSHDTARRRVVDQYGKAEILTNV
jgi:hypothetical protein